jgi:anti-anti-sigma factor
MGTRQDLSIQIEARNDVTSVALTGELDMATVPILDHQLAASERDDAKAIVIDLRDLSFIDSSGLHALLRAHRRSETNGHRFLLVGASPIVRRLCEVTGTEFLLDAKGTADVLGRFTSDGSRDGGAER